MAMPHAWPAPPRQCIAGLGCLAVRHDDDALGESALRLRFPDYRTMPTFTCDLRAHDTRRMRFRGRANLLKRQMAGGTWPTIPPPPRAVARSSMRASKPCLSP